MLALNQADMHNQGLKGYIKKINSRSIDFEFHGRTYQLNNYGVISHKSFNDGKAWYSFAYCDFLEVKDLTLPNSAKSSFLLGGGMDSGSSEA